MATSFQCFWGLFFSLSLYLIHSTATSHVFIAYLGVNKIHDPFLTSKSHIQLLSNIFTSKEDAERSILYSYKHSFSGFAAKLNATQATTLAKMKGVISVFKSKTLKLHTTRSWDFMGLTLDNSKVTPMQQAYGDNIVVGVFDTGIWPELECFKDPCLGPIPSSWRGECVEGENWDPETACNQKLIGARYYFKGYEDKFGKLNASGKAEYKSARDFTGHGTHTASIAVGSIVKNASLFGLGQGTARGGAPKARLAVYKTCWNRQSEGKCMEADILAAFDDALRDGVNVISISFGQSPPLTPFFKSSADIGSFHAMQRGITVVFSAGNDGPDPSLVQNVAPWAICVAASLMDRTYPTQILLDNNFSITGQGFVTKQVTARLVDPSPYFADGICRSDKWNTSTTARGRIILCFSTSGLITYADAQEAVKKANATGLIFVEPMTKQIPDLEIGDIPTVYVDMDQGTKIRNYYIQSPLLPLTQLTPSRTVIGKSSAPSVAYFSSRGPSTITPDILKPDITAPGITILAAWPPSPPTVTPLGFLRWNFQSGTSMSCPHVSGVVALLKSAHPDWSPAAIRSALMTTAYTRDTTHDSILAGGSTKGSDPFDYGAGHMNPLKAMDPGLVYDMKTRDYILYLCSMGYSEANIDAMVFPSATDTRCPRKHKSSTNINYPSITVSSLECVTKIQRTVRIVTRKKTAVYYVSIVKPDGVDVEVWPRVLFFSYFKQEISYSVTLKPMKKSQGRYDFGEISWSDGVHIVRSPLVISVNMTAYPKESMSTPYTTI